MNFDPAGRLNGQLTLGSPQTLRLVIPAGLSGKIKTIVQIISIALLIIYNQLGEFRHLAPVSLWAAMLITAYSGIEYFVRFGRLILKGEVPISLFPPSGPRQ